VSPYLGLVLAYVAGSIPAAYIAGKVTRGIDLRQHGSGNLGATNVHRVLGAKIAIAVLLFDAAKGAVPVLWFPRLAGLVGSTATLWAIAFGVAAIIGHVRPVFLLWKGGGKGVATAAGVFGALAPAAIGITLLVWFLVLVVSGYMSLASMAGAAVLPVAIAILLGLRSPLFLMSVAVAAFVFWTHRANIGRLQRGEEPRFGKKTPPNEQKPDPPEDEQDSEPPRDDRSGDDRRGRS
jgi:acyl phosphate:glycerol-3-phosphate acyltransferase